MKFVAEDGKVFDNAEDCKAYEAKRNNREKEKKLMESAINKKLAEVAEMIDDYFKKFPEELQEAQEADSKREIPIPMLVSMLLGK